MINGREVFIQERLHTEFAHWLKWSALSGAVVFLALAALDAVVYPVLAARFLVYRVAAASCLTLIAVAAGKVGNHRPRLLLGLAAVWISAVTIEAMILQTGGHLSPYATGMILLIVCVLAYIQGNMLFHVLAAASIYSIYVLPIMVLETITDFRMFFVANFFILSIILVMLTLRFLALRNFREQAAALYEVRTFGDAPSFAGGEAYADPAAIVRRLREEIAARRSTEKLLEASEKKYRTLFESAPDAFYINDLAGTFLDGNRKAEELTGYRLEEAVGRNFLSLGMLPLSQVPRALKLLALNALGRATGPDEFELVAKGGGCRTPVEISTFPAIIDGKRIVLGIARNISDRKRAEEALRHSESRYRSIADASMDVIYRLDPEGRVTYASPAIMRVLGYKVDEIMGRRFLEIIHQDDHPAAHAASRELREGTAVRSLDLRILRKGGGFIHGEVSIVPVLRDGAVYEIQGVIHDISERKRAEDALKSAKYRLEFLVSSTPAIIYTCRYGGDWGATFMSENLRDVLGYEVRENLEAPGFWFDHIHPGDRDRIQEGLQTLSEKGLHSHEYRFRHKDGTYRWMLDRVRVVRNKEGRPVECVGSWMDITERKKAEELLTRYRIQLEEMVSGRTRELQDTIMKLHEEIDERKKLTEELHRSKLFLTNILNSIQDGICVLDAHRKIMLVNNAVAKWVPEAAQIGFRTHTCADLFHKLGKCDDCIADSLLETGRMRTLVFPGGDEKDKKWFEVHSYPLNTEDGRNVGRVDYIRDVTAAKILEERITHYQEQLRALNYEMAALENRQQRRIAQELHDSIPQTLAFCKMRLESLEQGCAPLSSCADRSTGFKEIYGLLDTSIAEARSLIFKLAPPVLYELGLEPAVQQLLYQFGKVHPVEFHFDGAGRSAPIQGEGAAIMYGMVRELITNCIKHSGASSIGVTVGRRGGDLVLQVRDNGKGVDPACIGQRMQAEGGGFGLFSIRERVRHMEGVFAIECNEGGGACATIRIPLRQLQ